MPDYAKMYYELFGAITKTIELLQQAQIDTEEIYISSDEPVIQLITKNKKDEDSGQK